MCLEKQYFWTRQGVEHQIATEGQQCQTPELATSLFQSRTSRLDIRATADFGEGSAMSLNVGFNTVAAYHRPHLYVVSAMNLLPYSEPVEELIGQYFY
jgi:hypothetical protein